MAVSRPILLALLGALLAAASFLALTNARDRADGSDSVSNAVETPAPAPAKPQPAEAPPAAKREPVEPAAPAERAAAETGVPADVERALEARRTVVLFLYQRGSADDAGTAAAVRALGRRKGVAVFRAPVGKLADYRAITGEVGVTQAPSVVIVGKRGTRVVEGFVDPQTLAQEVADAR